MQEIAKRFMELFRGFEEAHGFYEVNEETEQGKKIGRALTLREPVTLEYWVEHLKGDRGLGIIPINNDNECWWGAIDVDEYGVNHKQLAEKIDRYKLPLILCRTKSGGAHILCFFKEPVKAKALQKWLKEVAAGLGFGGSEVFPKQIEVLVEKGDLGNWLNMPYLNGDRTERYAIKPDGSPATMMEFLSAAQKGRMEPKDLTRIHVPKADQNEFAHAPPCLQILCSLGFPPGTRNNGLLALGTFAKKAHPDQWQTKLEEYNKQYMDPPLDSNEVQAVVKQMAKKDYNYRCSDHPIVAHCNSGVCRTRKFGVGGGGAMPQISSLTVLETDPPIWFLDVEGKRMVLTTDQLHQQEKFQKVCIEQLHMYPAKMNNIQWANLINGLLQNLTSIEMPKDVKTQGQFEELLFNFCNERAQAQMKDDLLRGLPWHHDGWVYFRIRDLRDYLMRNNFKHMADNQIAVVLREINAEPGFFNIKGRGVNYWRIPENETTLEPAEPSPIEKGPV